MDTLRSASTLICICCIVTSIVGLIAPFGRMKKISNLIFGIFLIASVLTMFKGFSDSLTFDFDEYSIDDSELTESFDSYNSAVLQKTADNLVSAADNLLKEEGITAKNIEVLLKKSDNNSIYISTINIYITKDYLNRADDIKRIIGTNMSKEPVIIQVE